MYVTGTATLNIIFPKTNGKVIFLLHSMLTHKLLYNLK